MDLVACFIQKVKAIIPPSTISVALGSVLLLLILKMTVRIISPEPKSSKLPPPPAVPGLPMLGNLLHLSWIPYKSIEENMRRLVSRTAVTNALTRQQSKRLSEGKELNCFLDYLLSKAQDLSNEEVGNLVGSRFLNHLMLLQSLRNGQFICLLRTQVAKTASSKIFEKVCGDKKVSEDDLSRLPYLSAVFSESLRRYSPVPVIPPRYVHEDTEIGGFHISDGTQVVINVDACNMDRKKWDKPEEWNPERFLEGRLDPADLYSTMSFGAGKRVCAGALQAMLISTSAIGRLVEIGRW